MAELTIGGQPAETVFDLLGSKENDITYALGWGLAQSDDLLRRFLALADAAEREPAEVTLDLHPVSPSAKQRRVIELFLRAAVSICVPSPKRA